MFDNFGVGEFMLIAFFALLFFGPQRLPQIGAKLGRWLATLTQQSKIFMNQWRDEALAIQEAVEEVKGIRDEIIAARNEIASTMGTAQQDITDSLQDARGALGEARIDLSQAAAAAGPGSALAQPAGGAQAGEEKLTAVGQSQRILEGLDRKRGVVPAVAGQDQGLPEPAQAVGEAAEAVEGPALSAVEGPALSAVEGPEKAATGQVVAAQAGGEPAVAEGMVAPAEAVATEELVATEEQAVAGEAVAVEEAMAAEEQAAAEKQAAAEGLAAAQEAGEVREPGAPEQARAAGPAEVGRPPEPQGPAGEEEPEDEYTRTQRLIQEMLKPVPREARPEEEVQAREVQKPEPVQPSWRGPEELERLNKEVARLQAEMHLLRRDVQALRDKVAYRSRPQEEPAVPEMAVVASDELRK